MWQLDYGQSDVSLLVTVAGDYNGDGVVDAADYTVWRDALGQTVSPGLGADGDGDGQITNSDLEVWRANFGVTISSLEPATATPEPTAVLTAASALGCLLLTEPTRR